MKFTSEKKNILQILGRKVNNFCVVFKETSMVKNRDQMYWVLSKLS